MYTRIGISPKMQVPKSNSQSKGGVIPKPKPVWLSVTGCPCSMKIPVSMSTVHMVLFNKNPVFPDNTHPYSWFKVSTGSFAPKGNEVLDFKNASHLHRN